MKVSRLYFLSVILAVFSFNLSAQQEGGERVQSLTDEFDLLLNESETYQQFKVIPQAKLRTFRNALQDTLADYKSEQSKLKESTAEAEKAMEEAKAELKATENELAESEKKVDSIVFLGMPMSKVGYNVTVWAIIGALLVGLVLLYLAFLNANRVTKQAKKDKLRVDEELESLRKRSHEKQVKIKRELQTALNKLDEIKR